jgi:integrase
MKTFSARVEDYLSLRRSLGCRLIGQAVLLRDFGRFLDRAMDGGTITTEVVIRWAQAPQSKDPDQTARRLGAVRGFLRYQAGFDGVTEVPPPGLLGCGIRRKPPHIYSCDEVQDLLRACGRLEPRGGLRPHTCRTLFSLLLATGLRISEALHLEDSDVDLEAGVLTVRDGKFGKTRLVPIHPTASPPLRRYVRHRDRVMPRGSAFFRWEGQPRLAYFHVRTAFIKLRRRLGWTPDGRSRQPRIHDLRHTMAVSCLVRWYKEGISPDRRIAHLATYLGHVEVRDTYWYMSAVPELASIASERFARFATGAPEERS